MYEYMGAFIGFFHGFAATGLVFIANILEIANSGGDVRQQWGAAIAKTAAKMEEIEGALGRLSGLDDSGFAGAFVNGAKFEVGIKITVSTGIDLPDLVGKGLGVAGIELPEKSAGMSISKSGGGFKTGVANYLDFLTQLTPK